MQLHLTLKEIVQQPRNRSVTCHLESHGLLHQCPVLYQTVLPLLDKHCSQQRPPALVLLHGTSKQCLGIIWCSLGCAWALLPIFPASCWAPCPVQQLSLVCQHTAMIWSCFCFPNPWSYPCLPGHCSDSHCVDTTSQFCLMGRIKFNWQVYAILFQ